MEKESVATEVIEWLNEEFRWKSSKENKNVTKKEILRLVRGNTIPIWKFLTTYVKSRRYGAFFVNFSPNLNRKKEL